MARVALVFVFIMLSGVSQANAQTTATNPEDQLPTAMVLGEEMVLGEDWNQYDVVGPEDLTGVASIAGATDWIESGAVGLDAGPNASRVVVANLIVDQENVGVREAWEDANDLLLVMSVSVDPDLESMMSQSDQAPPAPCEEAERVDGTEIPYNLPYGATMCAQSVNIWIIVVSGTWNGETGTTASDVLTELILGG